MDATDTSKLRDAEEKVEYNGHVYEAKTNRRGKYSMYLPLGKMELKVTKEGYITDMKEINVEGNINAGTTADVALSPVLPEHGWRAVLQWGKWPEDLDSHTYFGKNGKQCHTDWTRKRVFCSNGIHVTLDVDDTYKYGPETTTFDNVELKAADCAKTKSCGLVFKVHDYSEHGKAWDPEAEVALFNHGGKVATYKPGRDGFMDPEKHWWAVFSLNATNEEVKTCTNAACT